MLHDKSTNYEEAHARNSDGILPVSWLFWTYKRFIRVHAFDSGGIENKGLEDTLGMNRNALVQQPHRRASPRLQGYESQNVPF